mmetsp:Transcript_40424/g.99980  ORF Transcript_40424/g.99980 Transcript_40424/m.99980 type:complete len:226 (-) Transcript_40424:132-809(-)|eukprot:CAMPEP_0197591310 /NCGR_PEP_ID=MMETSP1326-20131121/13002_1 /TAXON_ID=1155430 /ORGANISM="Genus nov. species nov., Strain RCC2288" /LENGTH=225 /DNA_ID=CAMNT_0043156711 /DNA_START=232 /DNA_END=912 /DNA_ORIENTATION=+
MPNPVRTVKWTQYEVLLPKPSYSATGKGIEVITSSAPMVRSILRSHAYEVVVSVEDQDRKWAAMAKAKAPRKIDSAVGAWENELAERRAEARRNLALPFAKRPPPPQVPHPSSSGPTPAVATIPEAARLKILPDLERRLARERRRAGQKPQDHESLRTAANYSETLVHTRAVDRKVFDHIPRDVARERSIITSGRRFTWGGRHKLALPAFNPHRERQLREKVAKF